MPGIMNKAEAVYKIYETLKDKDGNILRDENGNPRLGKLKRVITSEMRKKKGGKNG